MEKRDSNSNDIEKKKRLTMVKLMLKLLKLRSQIFTPFKVLKLTDVKSWYSFKKTFYGTVKNTQIWPFSAQMALSGPANLS